MAMAMALTFPIHGPARYAAASQPVKRPKEFVSFSYDENRNWSLGDKSLKWYYPPNLGADLNKGYDQFISHDDSVDEHLDGLLRAVAKHEEQTNTPIDAHILTWRGMMTKVLLSLQNFRVARLPDIDSTI
jgi:RAT1-interacting protein